jgi:hypothetical protein
VTAWRGIMKFKAMSKISVLALLSSGLTFGFLLACQKKEMPAPQASGAKPAQSESSNAAPLPEGAVKIKAKLVEIPGAFPANDIYNYAYVMRYEVTEVLAGNYPDQDILVGHYNPRLARNAIKDDLDALVDGNVTIFSEGDVQVLIVKPIEAVYSGAIEDEFFQDKRPRWFAVQADKSE